MRFIPKDPRAFPGFGWCYGHPHAPAERCSWCNRLYEQRNEALICAGCDAPVPPGVLRVVDDKEIFGE